MYNKLGGNLFTDPLSLFMDAIFPKVGKVSSNISNIFLCYIRNFRYVTQFYKSIGNIRM